VAGKIMGQTNSRYYILEKLGEGGRVIVDKAEDTKLQRPIARKFLPPEQTVTKKPNCRLMSSRKPLVN
jgi:serine/threonine protein kinase